MDTTKQRSSSGGDDLESRAKEKKKRMKASNVEAVQPQDMPRGAST